MYPTASGQQPEICSNSTLQSKFLGTLRVSLWNFALGALQEEQNEAEALGQGLSAEDSKAQGWGRAAGEGTACPCGSIRAAQGQILNRGSSSGHTGARMSCRPREPSSPHWAPSNHRGSPARDLQDKSRARAQKINEQRKKWEL